MGDTTFKVQLKPFYLLSLQVGTIMIVYIYLSCEILVVVLYLMLVFIEIIFRSCCCRDLTDKNCCFLNLHCSLTPLFFPGRKPCRMYQLSQHFVESYLYDKNFHRFAFLSDSRL